MWGELLEVQFAAVMDLLTEKHVRFFLCSLHMMRMSSQYAKLYAMNILHKLDFVWNCVAKTGYIECLLWSCRKSQWNINKGFFLITVSLLEVKVIYFSTFHCSHSLIVTAILVHFLILVSYIFTFLQRINNSRRKFRTGLALTAMDSVNHGYTWNDNGYISFCKEPWDLWCSFWQHEITDSEKD